MTKAQEHELRLPQITCSWKQFYEVNQLINLIESLTQT